MADGKTKKYRIEFSYFRNQDGKLYEPGSIVEIPAEEPPSKTWTLVPEEPQAKEAKGPAKAHGRPSDKDAL